MEWVVERKDEGGSSCKDEDTCVNRGLFEFQRQRLGKVSTPRAVTVASMVTAAPACI